MQIPMISSRITETAAYINFCFVEIIFDEKIFHFFVLSILLTLSACGAENETQGVLAWVQELVSPKETPEPFVSKFGLEPLEEAFPPEIGRIDMSPEKVDWAKYEERLEQAHYNLVLHDRLRDDVDQVVFWLLQRDQVIESYTEIMSIPFEFVNEEIFDNFLSTNVTIEWTHTDCYP